MKYAIHLPCIAYRNGYYNKQGVSPQNISLGGAS